jgi:exoribonuclease-2
MKPLHLLFDDDGSFKAGTVLAATDSSFQVETASGKRTKVRASHVLLRFESPAPAALLQQAQSQAEEIEVDFLWQCAPQQEFGFEELAREYHGHPPSAVEAAAILLRLHGAPVYFHRKGRGRYRPAPPEILSQALATVERRRLQDEQKQQYVEMLKAGELPPAIAALGVALLVRPDKNGIEFKALEQAASDLHLSPLRLLLARGAIASPLCWHRDSFLVATFPHGTHFPPGLPSPGQHGDELPLAPVAAFSIDDSATTEIDDAFSVQFMDDRVRVGIHIAAPATAIARGDRLDQAARGRMSTIYAPGMKITMLPEPWIARFSLEAGKVLPVLSLYVDVERDTLRQLGHETRLERILLETNLRHDLLDAQVTDVHAAAGALDVPHGRELLFLWHFARALLAEREVARGKPEPVGKIDYSFVLDGEQEHARVSIRPRRRGAPLDLIVAELMILANSHWAGWLAELKRAGIYRSQSLQRVGNRWLPGRVRMSTVPAPHESMGVPQYAWCTSPLRRYVDLVNQQQLIAAVRGEASPYPANDADLYGIVSSFDAAYMLYGEFQERLERYWCLRWLRQEAVSRVGATVLKPDLLRLDDMPLLTRVVGLPMLDRGQRVELDVLGIDEVDLTVELRLHRVLQEEAGRIDELDEEAAVFAETNGGEPTVVPSPDLPQAG